MAATPQTIQNRKRAQKRASQKKWLENAGNVLVLLLLIFLVLIPILWMIQMSFRTKLAVFEMPPNFKEGWTLDNYISIAETNYFRNILNSLIVSTATTLVSLTIGVPAAYAISRHRFKRQTALTFWILAARLALPIGFALPLFNIWVRIGLNNTYPGIVIAYLTFTIPLVIWVLRPFLDSIPREMEEAAIVDGASNRQTFFRIIIPLAAPGLVSVGILTFIMTWIEFFYALVFTRGDMMTAPVGLVNFLRYVGWDWGQITSAGVIVMVPVVLFSLFTHRYLISGLTSGAIKG
ncbi:MAG TPA: carbohydrate ABC transporter permease [Anaerolineales bacterium]|nr:carbohydrate ABC transporter permease [Anaerolineales bacterium]